MIGQMDTDDVDVAKLVQPEVVDSRGRSHEVALSQLLVRLLSSDVQLVQDPALDKALLAGRLTIQN